MPPRKTIILQRAGFELDRLRLVAPPWQDKEAVAVFAKARPFIIVPFYDLTGEPYYPEEKKQRGRPAASPELSVMPDAERAYTEIKWFLTEMYGRVGRGQKRLRNKEIEDRSYEFAAKQFGIKTEPLRTYCGRSEGEPHRLWPKPKITPK